MTDVEKIISKTKNWFTSVVLGLNLCPFAHKPHQDGTIRYSVSQSTDSTALLEALMKEIFALSETENTVIETSLLIIPDALDGFESYLDFLASANDLLAERGYEGVFQLASFHPQYRFAGEAADDPSNYTNRSPYPIVHILREDSLTAAIDSAIDTEQIPNRNIEKLRSMAQQEREQLFNYLKP